MLPAQYKEERYIEKSGMYESIMCEAKGLVGNTFLKEENKSLAARVSQNMHQLSCCNLHAAFD